MGIPARQFHTQQVHYLRREILFSDRGAVLVAGVIPAGSIVVDSGVVVVDVFNGSGVDTVDIGTAADPNGFATLLDVSSKGLKTWDEFATSDDLYVAADTTIVFSYVDANSDATTGSAIGFITYIPNN